MEQFNVAFQSLTFHLNSKIPILYYFFPTTVQPSSSWPELEFLGSWVALAAELFFFFLFFFLEAPCFSAAAAVAAAGASCRVRKKA